MAVKGSATVHNSPTSGHGPKVRRQRFAIPTTGLVRGVPVRSQTAPWFLKRFGSRPLTTLPLALVA